MKKRKEKIEENIVVILIVVLILYYAVTTIFFPTQPIIRIGLIDVSQSAQNHRFSNQSNQTYQTLVKEHCEQSIELSETTDKFIFGRFTTIADSEEQNINTLIDNPHQLCDNATTVPDYFPQKPGTYLHEAIKAVKSEIRLQRSKGINYPVAITIFIESDDGGENTCDSVKQEIRDLLNDKRAFIALIGLEGLPKDNKLKICLKDNKVKTCLFENHKTCTEEVIRNARNIKFESPRNDSGTS